MPSRLPQQTEALLYRAFAHRRRDPVCRRRIWLFRCAQVSGLNGAQNEMQIISFKRQISSLTMCFVNLF